MKNTVVSILFVLLASLLYGFGPMVSLTMATENPLSQANNKIGVHVLHPEELEQAAKLVNNDGKGQWGYVTVPISGADRDRERWIRFMNKCRELKVIPIIRVATVPNGSNWIAADDYDLVDFANFLNELPWPTKNRYVIIFNEVNRSSEWGGQVEPEEYALILSNAIDIFKGRSEDFFILPAGLDNAAPDGGDFVNFKKYLDRMNSAVPGIFDRIDGWNSHAYPNPAFAGKPWDKSDRSIFSFKRDLDYLRRFTSKELPVFITETGWDMKRTGDDLVAYNFKYAFENVWNDNSIVAVTPFLLFAGDGPFVPFSLVRESGLTPAYKQIQNFVTSGSPILADIKIPSAPLPQAISSFVAVKDNSDNIFMKLSNMFDGFFGLVLGGNSNQNETKTIKVAGKPWQVELADNAYKRQKGLSGREGLEDGHGMLFVFGFPGSYVFWMKDMKFDIDLVFIYDNVVVDVKSGNHNAPFSLIRPDKPSNMVLEVMPGSGIKVGDKFEF
jgi:uncharacterized protein